MRFIKIISLCVGLYCSQLLAQTPSQLPMLSKSGTGVPANVMLTMDDSGSMQFQTMPETVFASDTYATSNPVGSYQVRWDPNDTLTNTFLIGTVPGIANSQNYVLKALRSADTNTIFYNPEILYLPWLTSDGVTRRPNAPVAAAPIDPIGVLGGVVNLTTVTAVAAFNAPAVIGSNNMVAGRRYAIVSIGSTNFTLRGAPNNDVGIIFTNTTGPVAGTGTVIQTNGWCFTQNGNTANRANDAAGGCSATTPAFTHDPGVYFRLSKNGSGVYNAVNNQSNYTAYSINTAGATFTKYPKRTDCNTVANLCNQAQERQNFANWFTYYRNRNLLARGAMMEAFGPVGNTFRAGFGRINKAAASVDGVSTTVIESDTATYGGGGVRAFDAARKVQLFSWLRDLPASGGTPLVSAAIANGQYFSRTDNRSPWTDNPALNTNVVTSNASCRRSYQILVTDGYWNDIGVAIGNVDATAQPAITTVGRSYTYIPGPPYIDGASNTLADAAMYYWARDLQPKVGSGTEAANTLNTVRPLGDNISFWQNLSTFTVAMGVRGTLNYPADLPALSKASTEPGAKTWPAASPGNTTGANVDDLWHAALNGRGKYFSVKDPQELATAISSSLAVASGGEASTAGVATASTTLDSGNRKYKPSADTALWSGDISAEPLDANGQSTASVWTAADRLKNVLWSSRNIVTWDSGISPAAGAVFAWGSLSGTSQAALGTLAASYTTQFTDYLRGRHDDEGVGKPFRTRIDSKGDPFVLGDFINSNPVLIGAGFDGQYGTLNLGGATGYSSFLAAKAARTSVLFAGSNDGMLHGFKDTKGATVASSATDGTEVFAFVPRAVYPNLEKLLDKNYGSLSVPHKYFVDGPLKEADAYVKAPSASTASWRNYLMGSLGAGGRAVFAIDVTDTSNLNANSVRWEISSDTESDLGYVTGAIKVGVLPNGRWVAVFGNGFSSTNGYSTLFVVDIENAASSDLTVRAGAVKKLNLDTTGGNGLGGVTLIHDLSGQIANVYVGDLKGKMWKLNYDATANSKFSIDGGNALFQASDATGTAQSITASPVVYNHSLGGKVVVFGTGKLFSASDEFNVAQQSVYGLWDKPSDAISHPLARSNLASRTLSSFNGTGAASSSTFLSLSGTAVNWASQRGWVLDLSDGTGVEKTTSVLPGGRVIYPVQVAGFDTAYVSAVAPVQGTPGVCDALSGAAVNLLLPVESGLNPANHNFSTNGDSIADSSDAFTVGQKAISDGVDSIVRTRTTNGLDGIKDLGGGGGEGDCTGATCSKAGNQCISSPKCPEANTCLISLQSATGSSWTCVPTGVPPQNNINGNRQYDRIWRRIVVPPVH